MHAYASNDKVSIDKSERGKQAKSLIGGSDYYNFFPTDM